MGQPIPLKATARIRSVGRRWRRAVWLLPTACLPAVIAAGWVRQYIERVPPLPTARGVLPGHGVAHGLGFSTDGSTLVAADNAGHLQAWDPTSRRLRATAAHPFRFPVMAVSPEGRWTAVGGWLANPGETDLTRVYDVATGHVEATLPGTSSPCDLAFSSDGQLLIAIVFRSVSKDVAVQTWKTATWRLASESVIPIEPEGVAYSARLFQDGSLLALVSRKKPGTVTLWDSATGQQTGVFQPGPDEPSSSIYGIALSPDGRTLAAACSQARVILWDIATGRTRKTLRGPRGATIYYHIAFTPDGHSLVGAGHKWAGGLPVSQLYPVARSLGLPVDERPILEWVVWEIARGHVRSALTEPLPTLAPPGTPESIGLSGNFALTPDGRTLATAHGDGTIRLREMVYDSGTIR